MSPREQTIYLARGVRYAAERAYMHRDKTTPFSPEWRALNALAIQLGRQADSFEGRMPTNPEAH